MGTLGVQEVIVIFVIALVLFGPKKLPELGRTIGKALTEFRRASNDLKATFEREMHTLERESEQLKQSAQSTANEIYNHATYELPPAETAWAPSDHETSSHHDEASAPAQTATQPVTETATVGASAVSGAESNGTAHEAVSEHPETAPAIEGTVARVDSGSGTPSTVS
jgi:sec-independent protein translocase protein TatA